MMMRKNSIIHARMYDETLQFAQDYDLWSRISAKRNTEIIPESLYLLQNGERRRSSISKEFDTQLAAAVRISNGILSRAIEPHRTSMHGSACLLLEISQCEHISGEGLKVLPDTLKGFAARYGLLAEEAVQGWLEKWLLTVMSEAQAIPDLPRDALSQALTRLRTHGRVKSNCLPRRSQRTPRNSISLWFRELQRCAACACQPRQFRCVPCHVS